MKRYALLVSSLLLSCATQQNGSAGGSSGSLESGLDVKNFVAEVRPQDDFYTHVNGKWLEQTKIPADKSNFGSFTVLADAAEENLKKIVEDVSAPGGDTDADAKKIALYFRAYMDTAKIDAAGLKPLADELARIAKIADKAALVRTFGELERIGVRNPIGFYVNQDAKNSTEYIGYVTQSGLGMPDRDYYLKDDDKMAKARAAYDNYIDTLGAMGGGFEKVRAPIVALEKRLAEAQWTRVENRDRDKTYNKRSFDELKKMAPKIDWAAWFDGAKIPAQASVVVRQPSYFEALSKAIDEVSLDDWKAYLSLAVIDSYASVLPKAYVDANFAFHSKAIRGIEENRPRWKRAIESMDSNLGEALGKIYVSRHFRPEAKARMQTLVANLIKAFEGGIDGLEWMTADTKVEAQKKLAKFTTKIGYPEKWRDYSALTIDDSAANNTKRARAFEHDRRLKLLGGPIDRNEWFMRPHTVNAYYNSVMNEIVFPAAILQPPFFNLAADDAVNYGAIGAVIGHELSHGFDDQGRKSNGDGNLVDWWKEADATEFKARSDKMIAQYNAYEALPGKTVNGKLTLGENIGDLGGLTIAYRAYRLSLGGEEAPVIDGLTGDQRFFMGWAQIWRRKYRDAELERRLVVDPHSPSKFRVIGILSNMPEFYRAFEVKPGDAMHRPDGQRVKIW